MTEAPDTVPQLDGRLMWGQDGEYTALDDRMTLAALTGGRAGLARPAGMRPGYGLTIEIDPGWLAVVPCGDGSVAAAWGDRPGLVEALPGDPGESRTDLVWLDAFPGDGRWSLGVLRAEDTAGRPGLAIGRVVVPAMASISAQMLITPADAEFTIEGARGPVGPAGPPGPQGSAVTILGALDDPSELPEQGSPGDAWLISGDLWVWAMAPEPRGGETA
jgi:hypothetical protein